MIAESKGQRSTYIGAMPGKPVQCVQSAGVLHPLILIAGIDRVGCGYNGDPGSALLEWSDPSQSYSLADHHMIYFSNVLFVCTASDEGSIPGPLRGRLEITRLSGYDVREKSILPLNI